MPSSSTEPRVSQGPQRRDGLVEAMEGFTARLAKRDALPAGDRARVSLTPRVVTRRDEATMRHASRDVHRALERLIEHLLANPDRLRAWGIGEEALSLYQVDPGYPDAVQIARFDGLLGDGHLRLLEFNCDSPGGAARADVIDEAYERTRLASPRLGLARPVQGPRRLPRLKRALLEAYRAWQRTHPDRPERPRIVVTDWSDVATRADIDLTVAYLTEHGLDVTFADPRELTLDGDTLGHRGQRVDLVYKRVIAEELLETPSAQALLDAYRAGTVCLVNPPRSVLAGDKRAMAMLFEPAVRDALGARARAAVSEHVPYTRVLEDTQVVHEGRRLALRDLALDEQARFVLKPAVGYGGKGVHLGFETDPEVWGRLVDEHIGDGTWILQRLVEIPTGEFLVERDGRPQRMRMHENVNPFVFGGRFAGAYTRISPGARVNVSQGGAVAPTVVSDP